MRMPLNCDSEQQSSKTEITVSVTVSGLKQTGRQWFQTVKTQLIEGDEFGKQVLRVTER